MIALFLRFLHELALLTRWTIHIEQKIKHIFFFLELIYWAINDLFQLVYKVS